MTMTTTDKETKIRNKERAEYKKEHRKSHILKVMLRHVGAPRAIGMGELYSKVYGKQWNHRINDTRGIRSLITELRAEGIPICSLSTSTGGGYYVAATGGELDDYLARGHRKALKILAQEAKIRHTTLPELMGQISLSLVEVTP